MPRMVDHEQSRAEFADGEIDARLDLAREAAGIAALSWGIGGLATFEPRALVRADIERELDARIARLRKK